MRNVIVVAMCILLTAGSMHAQQEHVTNGSFSRSNVEDNGCILDWDGIDKNKRIIDGWTSGNGATPDYFNECHAISSDGWVYGSYGVPKNHHVAKPTVLNDGPMGQRPHAYGGLLARDILDDLRVKTYREYLRNTLAWPLVRGKTYKVSFVMAVSNGIYTGKASYPLPSLDLIFTNTNRTQKSEGLLDLNDLIIRGGGLQTIKVKGPFGPSNANNKNELQWLQITRYFEADQEWKYLLIGNLDPRLSTELDDSYVFIDDVSIREVVPCKCKDIQIVIKPDPAKPQPPDYKCCFTVEVHNPNGCTIESLDITYPDNHGGQPRTASISLSNMDYTAWSNSNFTYVTDGDEYCVTNGGPPQTVTAVVTMPSGERCSTQVELNCNCEECDPDDAPKVRLVPMTVQEPGQCCYHVLVENPSVCPGMKITGWSYELNGRTVGRDPESRDTDVEYTPVRLLTLCVPNGTKASVKITLHYEVRGKECPPVEYSLDISCECDCESAVKIRTRKVTAANGSCCYEILMKQDPACDQQVMSLGIRRPYSFDPFSAGAAVNEYSNQRYQRSLPSGELEMVGDVPRITPNVWTSMGTICPTKGGMNRYTLVLYTDKDATEACKTVPLDLDCPEDKDDCCNLLKVTARPYTSRDLLPLPNPCCGATVIEATLDRNIACATAVSFRMLFGSEGVFLPYGGRKFSLNGEKILLGIECGGPDCPCTRTIQALNENGEVICETTITLPKCDKPDGDPPFDPGPGGLDKKHDEHTPQTPIQCLTISAAKLIDLRGRVVTSFGDAVALDDKLVTKLSDMGVPPGLYVISGLDPNGQPCSKSVLVP